MAVVKYLAAVLAMFVLWAIAYLIFIYPAETACRNRQGEPVIDETWQVRCVEPAR